MNFNGPLFSVADSETETPYIRNIPKHVQDIMFGNRSKRDLPRRNYVETGQLVLPALKTAMNTTMRSKTSLTFVGSKMPAPHLEKKQKENIVRTLKQKLGEDVHKVVKHYGKLNKIVSRNPFGKIAFICNQVARDNLPEWCQDRLRTTCRSARFELPLDKTKLEDITPLQYLVKFTRLYKEQRRRYSRIFSKHKAKYNDYIQYDNLFPALNSMFGMYLSQENFEILCTALFIDKLTVLDEPTFIGVCTFADRLFWTSYLEYLDNDTFLFLGPNRSVLEFVDFDNLKRKLDGVNLSKEMHLLLHSLA